MPPWYAWIAGRPSARSNAGDFAPLCPELVVELASASAEGSCGVSALRPRMETYRANGVQLGWFLLPEKRAVEIWRAGATTVERQDAAAPLESGAPFPGLEVDLAPIWNV
ncbi:Uma2 family endonuclease [Cyanobium sp. Morenito 9A2]|uniref:Uma2 family endonuclease n=1 Tax=Cyanobium sp. Morenito 9A2 TaxID=2823718 RepID=UPI0028F3E8BD|nr:Uma2 family endonuclease [Cyanobium sp. Morenito 9A2]